MTTGVRTEAITATATALRTTQAECSGAKRAGDQQQRSPTEADCPTRARALSTKIR